MFTHLINFLLSCVQLSLYLNLLVYNNEVNKIIQTTSFFTTIGFQFIGVRKPIKVAAVHRNENIYIFFYLNDSFLFFLERDDNFKFLFNKDQS